MPDERFYEKLPVFDDFASITNESQYRALPDDWHVVVTDVVRSTAAIAAGMYKQVNIVEIKGGQPVVRSAVRY